MKHDCKVLCKDFGITSFSDWRIHVSWTCLDKEKHFHFSFSSTFESSNNSKPVSKVQTVQLNVLFILRIQMDLSVRTLICSRDGCSHPHHVFIYAPSETGVTITNSYYPGKWRAIRYFHRSHVSITQFNINDRFWMVTVELFFYFFLLFLLVLELKIYIFG